MKFVIKMKQSHLLFVCLLYCLALFRVSGQANDEKVFLDKNGVIKWAEDKSEVSLFGANYCLPSACDYRAAGYVGGDRKKMIETDMLHFARMGWDGLRLCFWGDFENTDKEGNLINNDHLDLLDYLIAKAKERNISMLLSPIVTYSSLWPDVIKDTTSIDGISRHYEKAELGLNEKAIAAQVNYLKQLMNHVNPYTGVAIKNEPSILFVEMINEPWHHADDKKASVSYINALIDAVRSTGCKKLLFHNVSQDFDMTTSLKDSKIDGVSFAWYPSGLVHGQTLDANYLPAVDSYDLMRKPELAKMGKIVYEFDQPDLLTNYMYPAMVRTFRSVGAQFAAMFSYDMLATAPYNLGWQTHFLNMVYTPNKAVSAIIAGKVMDKVSLGKGFGDYPSNTSFGPFTLDYENNHSEMLTDSVFIYSSATETLPKKTASLKQIIGCNSSPLVKYEGRGIYFLDKITKNTWRLEVYPDAVLVDDPFKMPSPDKVVSRVIYRSWPMKIDLPGLGSTFDIYPMDIDKTTLFKSDQGGFTVEPGLYILSSDTDFSMDTLPEKLGAIGIKEFAAPKAQREESVDLKLMSKETYFQDEPIMIEAQVYSSTFPDTVTAYVKREGKKNYYPLSLTRTEGYTYKGMLPEELAKEGFIEYLIVVESNGETINFPERTDKKPTDWDFYGSPTWKMKIINKKNGLLLVDPAADVDDLVFSRIDKNIPLGVFNLVPISDRKGAAFRLEFRKSYGKGLDDYTIGVPVKKKLGNRRWPQTLSKSLIVNVKGNTSNEEAFLTLVDSNGKGWSKKLTLKDNWEEKKIALNEFKVKKAPILPTGYPGRWNYWSENNAIKPTSMPEIEQIEWIQLSLRTTEKTSGNIGDKSWIELGSIWIKF